MENLGLGFLLMIVGMLTVFAILLIVIYGSQLLIRIINKIAPEQPVPAKAQAAAQAVDPGVERILQAAVDQITGGKGRIVNITRK